MKECVRTIKADSVDKVKSNLIFKIIIGASHPAAVFQEVYLFIVLS
jgi:hypothetical protein